MKRLGIHVEEAVRLLPRQGEPDAVDETGVVLSQEARRGGRASAVAAQVRARLIEQLYDHHGNVGLGATLLLVFDAWEHAYYLQYRNVRPDYVARLWDLVNWADVSRRFQEARSHRSPALPAR